MILAALPDGAIPLAVGTILALGGLTLVLSPLVGNDTDASERDASSRDGSGRNGRDRGTRTPVRDARDIPSDSGVVALREIEFDRETGKLSDSDYIDLKQRYTKIALDEMRAATERDAADATVQANATGIAASSAAAESTNSALGSADTTLDPVEAAIQRAREAQRACEVCGPRPEPDAAYCSSCGRYLDGSCGECGTPVELVGSHFCTNCGENLAAV